MNNRHLLLTVLEAEKSMIKVPAGWPSGERRGRRRLRAVLMWGRGEVALWGLLEKGSTLTTRLLPKGSSSWG